MHLTPRLRVKWLQVVSVMFVSFMSPLAALASCTISSTEITTYGFTIGSSASYRVNGAIPTAAGKFTSGDLDDLTKYPETACVPIIMAVKNTGTATKDIQVSPWLEYNGGGHIGYTDLEIATTTQPSTGIPGNITNLNQMGYPGTSIKTATTFKTSASATATVNATVTGPYSGKSMGTAAAVQNEGFHHYNVLLKSVPKNVTVFLITCGRLATDANLFAGGNITAGLAISGSNDADHVDVITSSVLNLPTLTLEKDLVGGTATSSQFTFTVTPPINGQTTFTIPNGKADAIIPMVPPSGPYTVVEHGPAGYTFSGGSGTNCTFSGSTATANPTPGTIPHDAICVFSDKAEPQNAHFTVNVVIVNDNGGAKTTTDFPLAVNGNPVTSGQTLTLEPGEYQLTETTDPLYAATFSGDCDTNGNITLALGQNKTCTITNNDRPTTLTVTNVIVNDNAGTKVVSDFPLLVNGSPIVSGTETPVTPGFYTITEPNTNGYSVTFSGACNSSGVVTVAAGTTNECIITNDDPAATLTIVNQVINDSGQTLTQSDFPATLDDVAVNTGVALGVQAGTHRVVSAGNGAYITTYAGDCGPAGIITLNQGDNKTCIIRNNDADRGLTVVTHVINDNGGTAVASDFVTILQAIGSPDQALNGSETGVLIENSVGFFGVGQAFLASGGYNVTFSGDCFGFINTGDTKVCTITDDDIAPQLTVIKNVVNNNGGTSTPADFTMNVTGSNVSIPSFAGSSDGVTVTLNAGTYSVDEGLTSLHYNKTLDSGCSGTLAVGQSAVCTVTNDDF